MPPRISWSNLLPGIIAFAAVALTAVGILMFAGVGRVRGETMTLYVSTNQARGVMRGTEVWIAGQKVGLVEDVRFRPPSNDTLDRVVIVVSVRERDAEQLRRDSHAQVRPGANIIGPVVVYLTAGTPVSPKVREGDTLYARSQSDFETASTKLDAAAANLTPIMADVRTIMGNVHDRDGTVGAMLAERGGGNIAALRTQVTRLKTQLLGDARRGRAGPALVMARARTAMSRVDSLRALLASPNSSYGRFRRDSTLGTQIAGLREELTAIQAKLDEGDGTLDRLRSDSALIRSVADARREMTLLFADFRRRPLHYVHF